MAELSRSRVWLMRGVYLLLCAGVIFGHLLPLETDPARWPAPDLLMALTFAWVLRRPDYVPLLSVAVVMLGADLLLQRPPGLMAALVVIASERLRKRDGGRSSKSFAAEWLSVALTIAAVVVINRLVLIVTMVPVPSLGPVVIQMLETIAVYPLVVLFSRLALGIRRLRLIEANAMGGRA